MRLLLGCIGDDFTGSTDLANTLVRSGMSAVQTIGVPAHYPASDPQAIVVALKSRTIAPELAVKQSLEAARWLIKHGAQQIYFKVCSTFDSTAQGNIGPVTEALMNLLGASQCIVTPAFPDNGRAVFKGHLFVGDSLLSESGMQHHPLTPMLDANLVRVMQAQSTMPVGLIDTAVVKNGPEAITKALLQAKPIVIVDAINNNDLLTIGAACKDLPLVVAGSGLALGLPQNFGLQHGAAVTKLPVAQGRKAVVSGSCSQATNVQLAFARAQGLPVFDLPVAQLAQGKKQQAAVSRQALLWALDQATAQPIVFASTAMPAEVKALQTQYGADLAGAIEDCLADIALGLVKQGVGQLVVAGGETSGAVVKALGVLQLQIGPQICPGVPWCFAEAADRIPVHLALKSGNFGAQNFFLEAFSQLEQS
jgi:3-dehydrotetronate 4-kinase